MFDFVHEALAAFKSGANPILVATDVAARGFRAWSEKVWILFMLYPFRPMINETQMALKRTTLSEILLVLLCSKVFWVETQMKKRQ